MPETVPMHTRGWKAKCAQLISAQVAVGLREPARAHTCAACGRVARYYHHPDYDEPELVLPLCGQCHRRVHGKNDWDIRLILAVGMAWYAHQERRTSRCQENRST